MRCQVEPVFAKSPQKCGSPFDQRQSESSSVHSNIDPITDGGILRPLLVVVCDRRVQMRTQKSLPDRAPYANDMAWAGLLY
ncbi:hypothetical protein [Moorena sp. SIO4A5]|uniref:hypothetical protein n=1 Tax=Moorena sp. SIO4A5 TaxID=2607838 RepID=UPI0013C867F4|nr:hypothetical protein [Moorena sp. SIO4A5]NEO23356.1 hypothetical protein [Moorena sp. SIO4A5]